VTLTVTEALIIIGVMALATAITRFLPFICFPDAASAPRYISYLGKMLPTAAVSLLVVYCLRDVSITSLPHGIPEAIAIATVTALHIWKKNTLLSVATGTIVYMLLVQFVF